jgi:hypothetical protein
MSLLGDAKIARSYLNVISDKDFAKEFVLFRGNFFKAYHDGLIISNSHGINYFDNVVKYWDNPISYIENLTEKELEKYINSKKRDDYEKNFILILLENKKS